MIINACQMLEGIKTDVLGLGMKVSKRIGNGRIQLGDIKKLRKDKQQSWKVHIQNS